MVSYTQSNKYSKNNCIKFETERIKSSLCDYSDAFSLVTRDITVNAGSTNWNDTHVEFKNCAPFSTCKTEINYVFIDEANHIYIAIPMYNLIEYSDLLNYSDASGSLCQFKKDEVPDNNDDLKIDDDGIFNSTLFQYKAALVGKKSDYFNPNSFVKNTQLVVPIKYLSNFWRLLEIPLINCKIYLELNWIEYFILSSAGGSAKFKINDAKLHVHILTLSTKDNVNLAKQLSNGFKSSVYLNNYQTVPAKVINNNTSIISRCSKFVSSCLRCSR